MSKLRKYARGKPCMVRIHGVCNYNPETTVLAHLNGAGVGRKHHDLFGAWCCSDCHDYCDGRTMPGAPADLRRQYLIEGILRTQQALIDDGKIITP